MLQLKLGMLPWNEPNIENQTGFRMDCEGFCMENYWVDKHRP